MRTARWRHSAEAELVGSGGRGDAVSPRRSGDWALRYELRSI